MDSMILLSPFQHGAFCDSVILLKSDLRNSLRKMNPFPLCFEFYFA